MDKQEQQRITEGYQPNENIIGLPPGAEAPYSDEVLERYNDHSAPNEYHYPNKAVIDLMRRSYSEGLKTSNNRIAELENKEMEYKELLKELQGNYRFGHRVITAKIIDMTEDLLKRA